MNGGGKGPVDAVRVICGGEGSIFIYLMTLTFWIPLVRNVAYIYLGKRPLECIESPHFDMFTLGLGSCP